VTPLDEDDADSDVDDETAAGETGETDETDETDEVKPKPKVARKKKARRTVKKATRTKKRATRTKRRARTKAKLVDPFAQ
jgi:hypothetical protein